MCIRDRFYVVLVELLRFGGIGELLLELGGRTIWGMGVGGENEEKERLVAVALDPGQNGAVYGGGVGTAIDRILGLTLDDWELHDVVETPIEAAGATGEGVAKDRRRDVARSVQLLRHGRCAARDGVGLVDQTVGVGLKRGQDGGHRSLGPGSLSDGIVEDYRRSTELLEEGRGRAGIRCV